MIDYDKGNWNLRFIWQVKGSVFPKALAFALPSSAVSFLFAFFFYEHEFEPTRKWSQAGHITGIWTMFTGMLGVLIVFRTQQAYARYWEGATLLRQTRGQWFNATSSLIAFCTHDPGLRAEVDKFQHCLVRLMSLLSCVGLQTVADTESEVFAIIATEGLEQSSLEFLHSKKDKNQRCEILMQWIQRLVVNAMAERVVDVPAPIVTRFFQELGVGFVNISQARNLTDIPFPFPYAQMIALLLLLHCSMTPVLCGLVLQSGAWAAVCTFTSVFAFVGTNYIASELESPFGEDMNDLPLALMQQDFNTSLWILLEYHTQSPPAFAFSSDEHCRWNVMTVAFSEHSSDNTAYQRQGNVAKRFSFTQANPVSRKSQRKRSFFAGELAGSLPQGAAENVTALSQSTMSKLGETAPRSLNPGDPQRNSYFSDFGTTSIDQSTELSEMQASKTPYDLSSSTLKSLAERSGEAPCPIVTWGQHKCSVMTEPDPSRGSMAASTQVAYIGKGSTFSGSANSPRSQPFGGGFGPQSKLSGCDDLRCSQARVDASEPLRRLTENLGKSIQDYIAVAVSNLNQKASVTDSAPLALIETPREEIAPISTPRPLRPVTQWPTESKYVC